MRNEHQIKENLNAEITPFVTRYANSNSLDRIQKLIDSTMKTCTRSPMNTFTKIASKNINKRQCPSNCNYDEDTLEMPEFDPSRYNIIYLNPTGQSNVPENTGIDFKQTSVISQNQPDEVHNSCHCSKKAEFTQTHCTTTEIPITTPVKTKCNIITPSIVRATICKPTIIHTTTCKPSVIETTKERNCTTASAKSDNLQSNESSDQSKPFKLYANKIVFNLNGKQHIQTENLSQVKKLMSSIGRNPDNSQEGDEEKECGCDNDTQNDEDFEDDDCDQDNNDDQDYEDDDTQDNEDSECEDNDPNSDYDGECDSRPELITAFSKLLHKLKLLKLHHQRSTDNKNNHNNKFYTD